MSKGSERALAGQISVIIALAALLLSGYTIYHQFVRVHHELRAAVPSVRLRGCTLEAQVVFMNDGNRDEVVLGGSFMFTPNYPYGFALIQIDHRQPGLTLKPGERRLLTYEMPIGPSAQVLGNRDVSLEAFVLLAFDSVGPDGRRIRAETPVARITISERKPRETGTIGTDPRIDYRYGVIDLLKPPRPTQPQWPSRQWGQYSLDACS